VITKEHAAFLVQLGLLDPATAGEWDTVGRPPDVEYPEENLMTLAGEVFSGQAGVVYDEAPKTPHFMKIEVHWEHMTFSGKLTFEVTPQDRKARSFLVIRRPVEGRTLFEGYLDLYLRAPFAPNLLAVFSQAYSRFEKVVREHGDVREIRSLPSPFSEPSRPTAPKKARVPVVIPDDAPDPETDFEGFLDALPAHSPAVGGVVHRPPAGRTPVDDMLDDIDWDNL